MSCGHTVLTLGIVHDAYGLCATIATRRVEQSARVEVADAIAFLYWHIWRLYLGWQPERLKSRTDAPSFLSYASHWLPRRIDSFLADATGDVGRRRLNPKVHAVSDSWDALVESGEADRPIDSRLDDGLPLAHGRDAGDADDDRQGDLGWLLGVGDRGPS